MAEHRMIEDWYTETHGLHNGKFYGAIINDDIVDYCILSGPAAKMASIMASRKPAIKHKMIGESMKKPEKPIEEAEKCEAAETIIDDSKSKEEAPLDKDKGNKPDVVGRDSVKEDIEVLSEINNSPRLSPDEVEARARKLQQLQAQQAQTQVNEPKQEEVKEDKPKQSPKEKLLKYLTNVKNNLNNITNMGPEIDQIYKDEAWKLLDLNNRFVKAVQGVKTGSRRPLPKNLNNTAESILAKHNVIDEAQKDKFKENLYEWVRINKFKTSKEILENKDIINSMIGEVVN